MKIRIISTIAILSIWGFLNKGLFYTADVITKNTLAVSTVNGGDGALLAQNAYASAPFNMIGLIVIVFILAGIWAKPVLDLFNQDENDQHPTG